MLPQADNDIINRERKLPGLSLALDTQSLADRLNHEFLEPTYLKYKPGTSCVAGVMDQSGRGYAVMVYPHARFKEIVARKDWFYGSDEVVLFNTEQVAVVPMSLDRRIKAAAKLTNPVTCDKFINALIGKLSSAESRTKLTVRYKPKRRIVTRIDHDGQPVAIIKSLNAQNYDTAHRGAIVGAHHCPITMLGTDDRRYSLAMGWIDGPSLCPVLSGRLDRHGFEATGLWLAWLHAQPSQKPFRLQRETSTHLSYALRQMVLDVSLIAPELADKVYGLADAVITLLSACSTRTTILHGDFSADQVILAHGNPVVIDWDKTMLGNPMHDVGSFLARLELQVLDGSIGSAVGGKAQHAFMTGYLSHTPDISENCFYTYHALALLLLANEGFRVRHPNWIMHTEALLDRVDSLISQTTATTKNLNVYRESPKLSAALDSNVIGEPLAKILSIKDSTIKILPPQLMRHKVGRRALIRYEAVCTSATGNIEIFKLLGKLNENKPDTQTPVLHDHLRAKGLDGNADHKVGVAACLGRYDPLNIWFQETVPGRPLGEDISPSSDPEPFGLVGAAIAHLHAMEINTHRRWSMRDEAQVLDLALVKAAYARTDLAPRIQKLRTSSRHAFEMLGEGSTCFIHRDFYQDQALVDNNKIWLVDLDLCALGDPCIDVGNFMAHIDEFSIRCFGNVTALNPLSTAFYQSYCGVKPAISAERIEQLRCLSLARHVYISTTFEERRSYTEPLLAHCEKHLERSFATRQQEFNTNLTQ